MKKKIGIGVILFCSILAAGETGRMINGLAYGWGNILIGCLGAFLAWNVLVCPECKWQKNALKAAGVIAVILCVGLLLPGEEAPAPTTTTATASTNRYSTPMNTSYSYREPAPHVEKEPITCWTCYGDGVCTWCDGKKTYDYYPDWAGKTCRMCDGSGRCPGCDGRGTYR